MTAGWTEDRVGALKKLWLEGQSASQIAKQLGGGVTRNAVIGKVHRLGLSGRATPSQPARTTTTTTFRAAKTRTTPPKQDFGQPSAPRRVEGERVLAIAPRATSPVPPTPLPVVVEQPGTATVLTLGAHMCKWPIGDPSSREFSFCGRRSSEGVYCIEHARVAYQPQVKKNGTTELTRSLRRYI
ncbi:MAG TPA: GcrA family cell cycle regulator [Brevundimonas sp.]|jgi:GcrA cell cycle regulator